MNIYYDPQKFGLEIVGEVDWSDDYDFDKHVLWFRQGSVAEYLWGHDSGCSCPSPFESHGIGDLHVLAYGLAGVNEFKAVLEDHDRDRYRGGSLGDPYVSLSGDAVDLLARYAEGVR